MATYDGIDRYLAARLQTLMSGAIRMQRLHHKTLHGWTIRRNNDCVGTMDACIQMQAVSRLLHECAD